MDYIVSFDNIESVEYMEKGIPITQFLINTHLIPNNLLKKDDRIQINGKNYLVIDIIFLDIIRNIVLKCVEEE